MKSTKSRLTLLKIAITTLFSLAAGTMNMLADTSLYSSLNLNVAWNFWTGYAASTDQLYPPPTHYASQTVVDAFVSDSFASSNICPTNSQPFQNQVNEFVYQLLITPLSSSQYALTYPIRHVMVLLNRSTILDTSQSDVKLVFYGQNSAIISTTTYSNTHFVKTVSVAEQMGLSRIIVYIDFSSGTPTSIQSCLAKIIAIREHNLNSYIQFAQYHGANPKQLLSTEIPFSPIFTTDAASCPTSSPQTATSVQVYFQPVANYAKDPTGSLLVSSIFFAAEDKTVDQFALNYWSYDGLAWNNHNRVMNPVVQFHLYDVTADGLYVGGSNTPQIVSYLQLYNIGGLNQVCALQIFGWPHCYVDPTTPIIQQNPIIFRNSGAGKFQISLGNFNAYYDPDLLSQNNPFCYLGMKNGVSFTFENQVLADTAYTLDPATLMLTLNLPEELKTNSSVIKNIGIQILDDRNPTVVTKTEYGLQVGFCDFASLQKVRIAENDSIKMTGIDEYSIQVDQSFDKSTQFTLIPPDCYGISDGQVVSVVQIIDGFENPSATFEGDPTFGQTDATNYNLCVAQEQSFCGYYDSQIQNITIFTSQNFEMGNVKQFRLRATFYSFDSFSNSQSATSQIQLNLIQSSESSDFYSEVSLTDYSYYIGLENSPIALKPLYTIPEGQIITQLIPAQVSGNVPEYSFSVDSSFNFIIDLSDRSFGGQSSQFSFETHLSNKQINTNLTISVHFLVATEAQMAAGNTAPYFKVEPTTPPLIPCLNFNQALAWKYSTPRAFDAQKDSVSYQLTCIDIDETFFSHSFEDSTLQLVLNQDYKGQLPDKSSFSCKIILKDPRGASKQYKITFESKCTETQTAFKPTENQTNQKPQPPQATIKSIDQSGQIIIRWNTPLIIPQNRSTTGDSITDCYTIAPIQIKLLSGTKHQSPNDYNFTFKVTEFNQTQTIVQLTFNNPGVISVQKVPDQIVVNFNNPSCFVSQVSALQVDGKTSLIKSIPRQKTGSIIEMPASLISSVKTVATLSLPAVIMNTVFQGFLSSLLSIVQSLGIVLHMFLIKLNYPVQLMNFFSIMFPLITFDAIPVANLYERWFHFSEIKTDRALTDQFQIVGYSSMFLVQNIGSLFLFINIQLFSYALLWFLRRYKPFRLIAPFQRTIDFFADSTLWSGAIDFFTQNYLVLSVVSLIQLQDFQFGHQFSKTQIVCLFLSIVGIIFSIFFPLVIFILYLWKLKDLGLLMKQREHQKMRVNKSHNFQADYPQNRSPSLIMNLKQNNSLSLLKKDQLSLLSQEIQKFDFSIAVLLKSKQHKQFMNTYGVLIRDLKLKTNGPILTILTPTIDFLLKMLIAIGVTCLVNWPTFTIFMFNFVILFQLQFLLYAQPYNDKVMAARQTYNSISFLVLNYHLFMLTDYADMSVQPLVATSVICLVWVSFTVNLILAVYANSKVLTRKLKIFLLKRRSLNLKKQQLLRQIHKQEVISAQSNVQETQLKELRADEKQVTSQRLKDATQSRELQISDLRNQSVYEESEDVSQDRQSVNQRRNNSSYGELESIQDATENPNPLASQNIKIKQTNVHPKQANQVQVKTKPIRAFKNVARIKYESQAPKKLETKETTIEIKKVQLAKKINGVNFQLTENDRLKEYKTVLAEEKELTPQLNLEILTHLAMRRYYSSLPRWFDFMDSEEKELRRNERMLLKRYPHLENYLNQVGYQRALFWEQAMLHAEKT